MSDEPLRAAGSGGVSHEGEVSKQHPSMVSASVPEARLLTWFSFIKTYALKAKQSLSSPKLFLISVLSHQQKRFWALAYPITDSSDVLRVIVVIVYKLGRSLIQGLKRKKSH